MPRVRFRIRTIMIAIAALALTLAVCVASLKWSGFSGARIQIIGGQPTLCIEFSDEYRNVEAGFFSIFVKSTSVLVAAACVYLSLAVTEASSDVWWRFWTIYSVVGLSCLLGTGWLLRRSPSSNSFRGARGFVGYLAFFKSGVSPARSIANAPPFFSRAG
jgi:hypothetical protein